MLSCKATSRATRMPSLATIKPLFWRKKDRLRSKLASFSSSTASSCRTDKMASRASTTTFKHLAAQFKATSPQPFACASRTGALIAKSIWRHELTTVTCWDMCLWGRVRCATGQRFGSKMTRTCNSCPMSSKKKSNYRFTLRWFSWIIRVKLWMSEHQYWLRKTKQSW